MIILAKPHIGGLPQSFEANVGVAPGTAFGPGGEGYFRLCYARKSEDVEEAMRRIEHWLATRSG